MHIKCEQGEVNSSDWAPVMTKSLSAQLRVCVCVLVCTNCNFYLLYPEVHLTSLFLLSTVYAVLAKLQQAGLISSEVCEELKHPSGVFRVQKGKSPEVMSATASVVH